MDLADLDRAVGRSQRYFLEDGLWELATGLWLALTVALPLLLEGPAANWAPVAMLLGSLAIRPAVLAAKSRWVFPRTGHVTYPEPGTRPPIRIARAARALSTWRSAWLWAPPFSSPRGAGDNAGGSLWARP